jgi:hypothetical protein
LDPDLNAVCRVRNGQATPVFINRRRFVPFACKWNVLNWLDGPGLTRMPGGPAVSNADSSPPWCQAGQLLPHGLHVLGLSGREFAEVGDFTGNVHLKVRSVKVRGARRVVQPPCMARPAT